MQYFNIERQINCFTAGVGKFFKPGRFIGLAIEDNAILAADIRRDKERLLVSRAKQFVFPEAGSFKDPEGLGKALGRFLQENRFAAKKAIIGIPAKWLMVREKVIPASTTANIAGILRIHAEREFSLNPQELAMDYAGPAATDKSNRLFLMAMLRVNLDNAILAVRWAGLDVISVTPTSAALFSQLRCRMMPESLRYLLYLRKDYAEFIAVDGEQTIDIRHIQGDLKKERGLFAAEMRRIISGYSNNSGKVGSEQLLIWDATSEPSMEDIKSLAGCLPDNMRVIEGSRRQLAEGPDLPEGGDAVRLAAPAMLARAYRNAGPLYIDFLNSRMNVRTSIIKKSQVFWVSAASFGMAILLLVIFFIWRGDKKDVSELRSKLEGMKEDISEAKDMIGKVSMAGGWYSERPMILDCLKDLTSAFPEDGGIWVTSLALTEEMAGVISGRATDEQSVIEILDQLKGNGLFSNVRMIYFQNNGRNSEEVSFSINFSYTGKE